MRSAEATACCMATANREDLKRVALKFEVQQRVWSEGFNLLGVPTRERATKKKEKAKERNRGKRDQQRCWKTISKPEQERCECYRGGHAQADVTFAHKSGPRIWPRNNFLRKDPEHIWKTYSCGKIQLG